jgi:phospholipid/cholesterol/gamma-HCH transport system substrate-binding protein
MPRMKRPRLLIAAAALAGLVIAPGCGLMNGQGSYHLTAYFPKAVAFYKQSKVKLMGLNVGLVNSISFVGRQNDPNCDSSCIKVGFSVNNNVPLPSDVQASILPLSLIGERNLTLSPAYTGTGPTAKNGDVIPLTRTQVPVEVDDILKTITDLAHAINPTQVQQLVQGAAATFAGHGQDFNNTLGQVNALSGTLAEQDSVLLQVANNIHQLASTLNSRSQELGSVIDAFAAATGVLSDERQQIVGFLDAVNQLGQQIQQLLAPVAQELPGDLAALTKVVLTVKVNAVALGQFVSALDGVATVLDRAYDPSIGKFVLRFDLQATGVAILGPVLHQLNLCPKGGIPGIC